MSKVHRGNGAPDQIKHDQDISLRSITPTTHLQRDLYSDASDLQTGGPTAGVISDAIFYQDYYQHSTWLSEIVSFGINVSNVGIRGELTAHNHTQQQKLTGLGTISNASSNPKNYANLVSQIILTKYEIQLLQTAANYLTTTHRKVVLVDTFTRVLQKDLGDITVPSSDIEPLDTHTVVLYRNVKGDILVIDPNKPTFSGHLQHIKLMLGCNVLVSSGPPDANKIYSSKPLTIPKTGPHGQQFRDCTDIAVKLAALLDRDMVDYVDFDTVMKSQAVLLISNNAAITQLPKIIVEDIPCRIKQVSHLVKLKQINDELHKCNAALKHEISNAKTKLVTAQAIYDKEEKDAYNVLDTQVLTIIGQCIADTELSGGNYA